MIPLRQYVLSIDREFTMEIGFSTVRLREDPARAGGCGITAQPAQELLRIAKENGIGIIHVPPEMEDPQEIWSGSLHGEDTFRLIVELCGVRKDRIVERDVHLFEESFWKRLESLGVQRTAGIILRHPEDLFAAGGDMMYATMQHLKDDGIVKQIGISVRTGEEIDRYLYHYDFDVMQLPLDVFDQRLLRSGHLAKLKMNGIAIHVHSPFLREELFKLPEAIDNPDASGLSPLLWFRRFLERENLTLLEGALGFLRAQPELDVILADVSDGAELREIAHAFEAELSISENYADFAIKDSQYFDLLKRYSRD